jgi:hypothetical protein
VTFYKDVGSATEPARCRRCNHPFTSKIHVEDLITVERELGYRYEVEDADIQHYQWICPPCRRVGFALAQGRLWREGRGGEPIRVERAPTPRYVNPGLGEGPLGNEDLRNFHP